MAGCLEVVGADVDGVDFEEFFVVVGAHLEDHEVGEELVFLVFEGEVFEDGLVLGFLSLHGGSEGFHFN